MPQNRVQYQEGFSLSDFIQAFGTEEKCLAALENARWPNGFRCQQCGAAESFGVIHDGRRKRYQCKSCRHQTTATAGTIFDSTKLPLATWFQAIYLITHAKNGISAMELRRQLGVSYPTGWRIKHKLMQALQGRDSQYLLQGIIHIDDAYFGGELSGGKAGRGSENKIPFVAAVEAIRLVKPAIYCKGTEYQDASSDVTGNIHDDLTEVRAHGGEVRYIGSVVFSSTKILNRHFDHLPQAVRDYCSEL